MSRGSAAIRTLLVKGDELAVNVSHHDGLADGCAALCAAVDDSARALDLDLDEWLHAATMLMTRPRSSRVTFLRMTSAPCV